MLASVSLSICLFLPQCLKISLIIWYIDICLTRYTFASKLQASTLDSQCSTILFPCIQLSHDLCIHTPKWIHFTLRRGGPPWLTATGPSFRKELLSWVTLWILLVSAVYFNGNSVRQSIVVSVRVSTEDGWKSPSTTFNTRKLICIGPAWQGWPCFAVHGTFTLYPSGQHMTNLITVAGTGDPRANLSPWPVPNPTRDSLG